MEQALYRKYRPRSFSEAVGQEHVTRTLERAIKAGRISHAYLFTGPKGVGKTSVARILAHEANSLPYKGESIHLDIIEIDAASNRRIDEIRDLRDKVRIAPASAKYKVYIIDEVHMLTREAFNALLKTLEEPPAHCIFILATTEAHKLPETIISRAQRFEFKPVSPAQAAKHLQNIAKREKIDITPQALELLAEFGDGSFRDSIGYLDQLSSASKKISEDDVRELLGLPSAIETSNLVESLRQADAKAIVGSLQNFREQGLSAAELAASISKELRNDLIQNGGSADARLLKQLLEVKSSSRPYDYLEICLLESAAARSAGNPVKTPGRAAANTKPETPAKPKAENPNHHTEPSGRPAENTGGNFSLDMWDELLDRTKKQAASLYTALRLADPSLDNGVLLLSFQFPLHKKKVEASGNKAKLADIIEELSGSKIQITCAVKDKAEPSTDGTDETSEDNSVPINSITNVFGAAEMLES